MLTHHPTGPITPAPSRPEGQVSIHPGETLPQAMQHILVGQLEHMTDILADPAGDRDEAVHKARKAMKRARGMLRLVRDEVGYAAYRNENVVLRDVARLLAPVRDTFVTVRTVDRLRADYRGVLAKGAFATTREYLEDRHDAAQATILEDRALMTHVQVTLRTARARLAAWDAASTVPPPTALAAAGVPDGFDCFRRGLRRVYRRGRLGMERAYREDTEEAFHEWRKRVKYLRYQMEALQPLWPEMIGAQVARLDRLGEALGEEHDLAVLARIVRETDGATADERERTLLLALTHRTRRELQWEARRLGVSLYAEKPSDFVRRIGAYWESAWA